MGVYVGPKTMTNGERGKAVIRVTLQPNNKGGEKQEKRTRSGKKKRTHDAGLGLLPLSGSSCPFCLSESILVHSSSSPSCTKKMGRSPSSLLSSRRKCKVISRSPCVIASGRRGEQRSHLNLSRFWVKNFVAYDPMESKCAQRQSRRAGI